MTNIKLPKFIGHRGARGTAPENTLLSIKEAKKEGCSWIEIDVKLTADNVPILFHDDALDKITNGKGLVAETSFADIKKLKVTGNPETTQTTDHDNIPSFKEALELIFELDLNANIEIKPCIGREIETAEIALKLAQDIWQKDKAPPIISSFKDASLKSAMNIAPNWPRAFLMDKKRPDWQEKLREFKAISFNIWDKLLDKDSIKRYQTAGLPILVFTINDAKRAKWLFEHGIESVFTDFPQRIKEELKEL